MPQLNCLLVDDEPPALQVLEKYVAATVQLKLIGSCSNAFTAMEYLHQYSIDLLFLDIKMPQLSGLSFIRTLRNPPSVIFTTAFKEYAVDAFELNAVDYLLKPFSFERFLTAVNKVHLSPGPVEREETVAITTPPFLYFRADRQMVKVLLEEILYVESLKDYVKIHRLNSRPLLVKQLLSTLENMLPKSLFVRIHRSYIVSLLNISAFTSHEVSLGSLKLPVGRVYSQQFQQSMAGMQFPIQPTQS